MMEFSDKELIIRFFSGDATDAEIETLDSWIGESEENRRFVEDCYFIWQSSEKLHIIKTINTSKALASFKEKRNKKEKITRLKRYLFWTQRVAAILLLPALALSYTLYRTTYEEDIRFLEVKTSPGVITSVILPDSTKVWINSCGYLKYPTQFKRNKREVVLEGEGYFEVSQNKNAPFFVKIHDNYSVKVLGTHFNVRAYADDRKIETTLVEGSVGLNINTTEKKIIQYVLKPNQKAVFENNQLYVQWVDPIYEMGWKDGKMYFKNHPMEEVLKRLSRHYNVTFEVKSPKVWESLITAKFESEQLSQVLEYIKIASGIRYFVQKSNIEGDRISKTIIELTK
ncbi:MAG: FecR family protein [Massilibacteroides sp.]|nr:FecR family protein [Massilibacteroides sp.]MDD3062625.1 FecR family protein [Massilibacteroides sp.]MDD4116246.1 FecR family protein [Massilibacteroides sp.]MDD4659547.1 FecR family protein [Massilibacteroides sp.]